MNLTPSRRWWIYRVAQAAVPLLVVYGIVAETAAPLWVALASAVLVPELAARNVPDE